MPQFSANPFYQAKPHFAYELSNREMLDFHRSLEGYAPTPLRSCPALAKKLGLKEIMVKDESFRFDIKAFKALGASFAIHKLKTNTTLCAATDGNHGRAVAWTAKRLNLKAKIYMPSNSAPSRISNIKSEGAQVELVNGTFDHCVQRCADDAQKNGWQAVSDTAYPGYMEIPGWILLGYTTLFQEMEDLKPDLVLLPAGVGGLAAAGASFYTAKYQEMRPKLVCVEPEDSDCFLESIRHGRGKPMPCKGKQESIMAGLNCGLPSPLAWPIVRDAMDLFLAIEDSYAIEAMKAYAHEGIVSGESGASGLAGLLALMDLDEAKKTLGINKKTRVLLINTEGDTDPKNYLKITGQVTFTLNGKRERYTEDKNLSLLKYLRDHKGLMSPKDGCSGQAACGACMVEMDGKPALSCVIPMKKIQNANILTIEGFDPKIRDILTRAFVKCGAVQCGFCTPGFITRAKILLDQNPSPTQAQIRAALKQNFCRCTGYHKIVKAIKMAAQGEKIELMTQGGVGDSVPKYDALNRALGKSPFVADLKFKGMVHGAFKFSDHPRARVKKIDCEEAKKLPGVLQVFFGEDVPGERITGMLTKDWPLMVLKNETTRYEGDVIACVIAETEEQARKAVQKIKVEYEVLKPLSDIKEALTSPIHVHESGNLLERCAFQRGDSVDQVITESAYSVTGTYETQRVEHAYLETECAVALPWRQDGIELFSQSQGVYVDQEKVASILDIKKNRVKVNLVPNGGAFGGKEDLLIQGHACLAAWLLKKPVRIRLTREESIRMSPKRHPMILKYSLSCDEKGKLTALKARILGDTGAYASAGAKVLERAAGHATGGYHTPNVDIQADAIYTNNPPCGAMRGFGVNQAAFAMESCMEELCKRGGFDPWEFRYLNALTKGSKTATGQILKEGVGVRACLEALKEEYKKAKVSGLACGIKNCGIGNGVPDESVAKIKVCSKNRIKIFHGWTEMGQGVNTLAAQILSGETGIPLHKIEVMVRTQDKARAGMTTASRGTSLLGNSLIEAVNSLKKDLKKHTLKDLKGKTYTGRWVCDFTTKPGAPGAVITHYSYGFAAQLVVLNEDGAIQKVIAAHDVGKIMNPVLFESQIQGSVHMGLGYALSEDLPVKDSKIQNFRLGKLGILKPSETPTVKVLGVEVKDPWGPYGAKGVGEIGLVPTAGAVANAFYNYDGIKRFKLPLKKTEKRK